MMLGLLLARAGGGVVVLEKHAAFLRGFRGDTIQPSTLEGMHAIGLLVEELGAPMDVLWFRLSRRPEDVVGGLGRIKAGRLFVMLNRGDYWQCGFVIAKGTIEEIRRGGLDAFRAEVARLAAVPPDRA